MKVDDLTKGFQHFYFWLTACIVLLAGTLFTALHPLSLPNASLVCYGGVLICIWQIMPTIRYGIISILVTSPQKRFTYSICFNSISMAFIYISIVSGVSTFLLFPHPVIHKVMAIFFYIFGAGIALWAIFHGGLLLRGKSPEEYISYYRQSEKRKQQLEERLARLSVSDKVALNVGDYLDRSRELNEFKVNFSSCVLSRFFYILLWLCIPVWIFIAIPLRSYSWSGIPPFFIVAGLATILLGIIWVGALFRSASYQYKISERGISQHGWLAERALAWDNVAFLYLNDQMLMLRSIHGSSLYVRMEDLEFPEAFWQKLQHFLPLKFFLISEEGWASLQKLLKDNYRYFTECYYDAFAEAKKGEKSGKRKKKKKPSKNRG